MRLLSKTFALKTVGLVGLVSFVSLVGYSNITSASSFFDFFKSKNVSEMPEFKGISSWINSPPLSKKDLKGKVVLIDFWTYSCVNCVRTFPALREWHRKYKDKGLVIVGVHAPEFSFEKLRENVVMAAKKYRLNYPIAQDNEMLTWNAYRNQYWPAKYLINKEGRVVYQHFGEGRYEETESRIREALGLKPTDKLFRSTQSTKRGQTPEIYLGTWRSRHFIEGALVSGKKEYSSHYDNLPLDFWSLKGEWEVLYKNIKSHSPDSELRLNFKSKQVYLVIGGKEGSRVTVTLSNTPADSTFGKDAPKGTLTIDGHRLYHLANLGSFDKGTITLRADSGVEFYAFTFGLE